MKVCLIGNSHLATLKRAWDLREKRSGLELTFFGAASQTTKTVEDIGDGRLMSADPRVRERFRMTSGREYIDVGAYDVFAFVGVGLEFRQYQSRFHKQVLFQHAKLRPRHNLVSAAAHEQAIRDTFATRPAVHMATAIRSYADKPIVLVHSPCPAETIVGQKTFEVIAKDKSDPFLRALYELYLNNAQLMTESRGWSYLPQPPETLFGPGLTLEAYSQNSRDVGWTADTKGPPTRGDDWHMNAAYGTLVLDALLAKVSTAKGKRRKAVPRP